MDRGSTRRELLGLYLVSGANRLLIGILRTVES
jgi:hypothetical protein